MNPLKLLNLLVLTISVCTTELATGLPASKEKTKAKRGPRQDLNETGIFLFPHPYNKDQKLLCKNCSEKALSDSTYGYQQQYECINQTFDKYKGHHMSPYCNDGNDLGCGQPPEAVKNSHWICDTGYSNIVHTVYSTCQLVCNSTGKIMKEIYCREILQWYVDNNITANACSGPLLDKDEGKTENRIVITVVSICAVLFACISLAIIVYCCKNGNSRRNSHDASDVPKGETENEIPLHDVRNSIGTCSLGKDDDNESSRLLTTETDNQNSQAGDQLPDSEDSGLGIEGQTQPNSGSSDSYFSKVDNVGSHKDQNNGGTSSGSPSNSNPSSNSSGRGFIGGMDTGKSGDEESGNQSVEAAGSHGGSNNLRTSDKSVGTDKSSEKEDKIGQRHIEVFVPNSRTSESGFNANHLQGNIYSAPKGSDVYFVPSKLHVRVTSIKRKGDEEELRGRLYDESIENMYVLKDLDYADAGIYIFTMVKRVDNANQEFTDTIELFVGESDPPQVAPVEVVQRDGSVTDNQIQNSTIIQDNSTNSSSDITAGQRLNTERPPPEGAENDQQISGQVNPLYNGARPKTSGTRMTQTNVLVSGQSNKGNQDIPRATFGPIVSNDLNRMQKESKNNLDQFDSPRNISANENNLMSSENNTESSSVVENVDGGRVRGPPVPHLCVDSLNSGKSDTSENNNSRQSHGTAGNREGEHPAEYTLSTELDKASANKDNIEKPLSLKMPLGPPLDFDSMLSSGKIRSENHLVCVDNSNNGNRVGTETDSNGNSLSGSSVELPVNVLDDLKPPLDFNELLSSKAEDGSARNPPVVSSTNVPATEQPLAMNHEGQVGQRQDPSGQVWEPVVREGRPTSVDETAVKTIHQRDVRGERSEDIASHREPTRPQARPLVGREVRPERGAVGGTLVGDTGLDSPQLAVRGEPAVEILESDRVARGLEASEKARNAQIIKDRCREPYQCNTHLSSISDSAFLQRLSHRANPTHPNGEARSWFGLALFYGYERHFLEAVEYALQSQIDTGPMHHLMTNLFVKEGFKVGHVVSYFTRVGSDYPEIVDLLIDDCVDHVDCGYCERLRRRSQAVRNNT